MRLVDHRSHHLHPHRWWPPWSYRPPLHITAVQTRLVIPPALLHAPMYTPLYTPPRIAPFASVHSIAAAAPDRLSHRLRFPHRSFPKFGPFDALRRLLFSHPTQRAAQATEAANDRDRLRPDLIGHTWAYSRHAGKSDTKMVLRRLTRTVESYHSGSTQNCAVI